MTQAVLVQAGPDSAVGVEFYGAAREFWRFKDHEAMLAGPYETGKTLAALHKLNAQLCKYPGAQGLMVRRTYKSLVQSAMKTYERKVLSYPPSDRRSPIEAYGGRRPEHYDYPNGSRLVLGGMDNPDRVLSSEYDFIYVNQAEELELDHWEALTGRCTGRAGNVPHPQIYGDCNPGPPTHWILHRPTIRVFESRHEDNPTLFDPETGEITEQGRRTMRILDALTGVRKERGRYGRWVSAEGQVYEYDAAIHLVDRFDPPADWPRYWVCDFGFTNPFVWQEWVVDGDGRTYLHREIYHTRRLVENHAADILIATEGSPAPQAIICDHDAEGRATLEQHLSEGVWVKGEAGSAVPCDRDAKGARCLSIGTVHTRPAVKRVSDGIQAVQSRMQKAGDDKPRLFIMRDALVERDEMLAEERLPVCTEQEFPVYVWPKAVDGKPQKEAPVKDNDHGMDAMRYLVAELDGLREAKASKTTTPIQVGPIVASSTRRRDSSKSVRPKRPQRGSMRPNRGGRR